MGGSGSLPVGMERAGARLRASTRKMDRSISVGDKGGKGQRSHLEATINLMSGVSECVGYLREGLRPSGRSESFAVSSQLLLPPLYTV